MPRPRIIAMWSGPRNLSTAMMRSFGARNDCHVVDEPFYAAYLAATGLDHPMRTEVIANGESDPGRVTQQCLEPARSDRPIVYQKHMTHHMIDGFETDWIGAVTNVFLIRSPARVLASYAAKTEAVSTAAVGFNRQRRLFDEAFIALGSLPPVVDAADILVNPEGTLRALCAALDIPFERQMLSWRPGPRPEDGIWAKHWYDAVWKSTGFKPGKQSPEPKLAPYLQSIQSEVQEDYNYLRQHCLTPSV